MLLMPSKWSAAIILQVCHEEFCLFVAAHLNAPSWALGSTAESNASKDRQARLVSECHELREKIMKLSKEADELRMENLALERKNRNAEVEAEQKLIHSSTAQLNAQHEAALLRERNHVMQDEMEQLRQSNARLVQEVRIYYQNSGRLRNRLETGNAEIYRDVEVIEQHIQAVHDNFESQIQACCAQVDVLQSECEQRIHSVDKEMDDVKV